MNAAAGETVRLPTRNPRTLSDALEAPCDTVAATLIQPSTPPPWPAVVVSTTSATPIGLQCGDVLARNGFAALVLARPDPRRRTGGRFASAALDPVDAPGLADAFHALSFLHARETIRTDLVHLIGFGGSVATLAAYEQIRGLFVNGTMAFASHLAFFDPAAARMEDYRTTGAPVTRVDVPDDREPSRKRRTLIVEDLRNGGSSVVHHVIEEGPAALSSPATVLSRLPLPACSAIAVRIDPLNRMIDEVSGQPIAGWPSRMTAIRRGLRFAPFGRQHPGCPAPEWDRLIRHHLDRASDRGARDTA